MLSWGVADFLAKKGVDKIGAVPSLMINQAVALGPIAVFAVLFYPKPIFSLQLVLLIMVTGLLGFLGYLYLYKGLRKGNLSVVSPISASWFVITTIVASLLFQEALLPVQIAGIGVVFAGVFLTSANLSEFKRNIGEVRSNGALEAVAAMVAWGFAFAFIKPVVVATGPILSLLLARVMAFAFLFSYVGVTKTKIVFPTKLILMFLVVAGLLDALGYAAFNLGVSAEYVSIISPIAGAYPAITVLLARFFLKEKMVHSQKVGVISILTGLVLMAVA